MSIVLQDIFGRQYSLEIPVKIGSDSSNDIVLLDSSISPFHAVVQRQGDGAVVMDQESDFGVFVNQKQIKDRASINPGDWFSVGKVLFTIVQSEPPGQETVTEESTSEPVPETMEVNEVKPAPVEAAPVTERVVIPGIIPPVETLVVEEIIPKPIPEVEDPYETTEPVADMLSETKIEPEREAVPELEAQPESSPDSTIVATSEIPEEESPEPVPTIEEEKATPRKLPGLAVILGIIGAVVLVVVIGGMYIYQRDTDLQGYIAGIFGGTTSKTTGEGPGELNLNDVALNTVFSTSYIQQQEDMYTGVDESGATLTIQITQTRMEQSTPDWSNYTKFVLARNGRPEKDSEFSIINAKVYKRNKTECSVFADSETGKHEPTNWPQSSLTSYALGSARKIESGVVVNGVPTDKYGLTMKNSPFVSSLQKMPDGELYRAQNGGYLVKLKITQVWAPDKWKAAGVYGFGNKPITVTNNIDFTYYPEGKLKVIVPAVCAGKVK